MDNKTTCANFLGEIRAEANSSRKCLERIPESLYKFKPHETSMEMGYLALLVAEIPQWVSMMIKDSVIDFANYPRFEPRNTATLLAHYEECLKGAESSLEQITEEQLKPDFELKREGKLLYSSPKIKAIGETINHWVHHRGQLTVYMRMNGIPVPSIYGRSGDEQTF